MIGKFRAHHGSPAAGAHDFIAQRLGFRARAVRLDGDRVTRLVQRHCDRTADAACGAGHQRGTWNPIRHLSARALVVNGNRFASRTIHVRLRLRTSSRGDHRHFKKV